MALSKVDYNSLNVTAAASKALKWNSDADGFETGDIGGSLVLLETQTASSSATIDFTSNIDDTYDEYVFKFYDIHPSADITFGFQVDTGTNTSYNQTITSTYFAGYHTEDGGTAALAYITGQDQGQGSGFQTLADQIGNGNDESCAGYLHIFNPSSATFVKHFIARCQGYNGSDYSTDLYCSGYFNTATALTRVQFKFSSGDIDAGTIQLFGVL